MVGTFKTKLGNSIYSSEEGIFSLDFQFQVSTLFLTTILKSKTKLPYNILYMAKVH